MDRTVPPGAALLLDFIGKTEVGREGREGYDVIYANKQGRLAKPITSMTLDEVIAAQAGWSKNHGSSAAGRYQFMRATLRGLMAELGLRGAQKLDPDLQDRLAYHLLKRRGYQAFMAGGIDAVEFAKRLAMEWASFPVLAATKGAHRNLARGQSYYAGDGLNKALVPPEAVETILLHAFHSETRQPDDPGVKTSPAPKSPPGGPAPQGRAPLALILILAAALIAAFIIFTR